MADYNYNSGQQPYGQQPYNSTYGQNNGAPSTPPKKDHVFLKAFVGALLACIVALGGYSAINASNGKTATGGNTVTLGASESSTINAAAEDETLPEAVAQKALPSVACIYVYTNQQSSYYGFGASSTSSDELTESSLGSGVVLSADGYILTNYHVVENSDALKVNVGGQEYDAEVVGTDASSDLAVIKAKDASGLTAADIGDSDSLIVGEWVMTIGSPFGLEQSVATGVVSATSRSQIIDSSSDSSNYYGNSSSSEPTIYPNMIQTDAAINPGNSGGALVDSDGKVIGINTLITSYSGNYSGVGFAIPINYAINIAQQIISGQTPTHAQLGVSLTTVNSSIAKRYSLAVSEGAYVSAVSEGSGAAQAGIKEGDIVTAVNGQKVASASDLMLAVREHNPGDEITVTVNRDGSSEDLKVTLGEDSSTAASASSSNSNSDSRNSSGGLGSLFGR